MRIKYYLMIVLLGVLSGCGAGPAPPPANKAAPVVESPDIKLFAGEWSSPSRYLHLEADGTGYAASTSNFAHRAEVVMREDKPYWVIDFPDEEYGWGNDFNKLRATSKRLTMFLGGDTIEFCQGMSSTPLFKLKKRAKPRPDPMAADFAGDWKVMSVSHDPKDPIKLDRLKELLKLRFSLAKDGTGTFRVRTGAEPPDAKLTVKTDANRFVLDGLHGKEWDMKLFFTGENSRLIQLREKKGGLKFAVVPPDANDLPF